MKDKQLLFDRLIDGSLDMLRSTAYSILGNAADADDAVQEALCRAWKKYNFFCSRSKLSSWVCRITINVACDMLRQKKREQANLALLTPEHEDDHRHDLALEELQLAVCELTEPYRSAITLGVLSGMSGEEAARKLDCKLNTLYWRISRAKEILREKLKGF